MNMNKALWVIAGAMVVIAIIHGMGYHLERSYLLDELPTCKPVVVPKIGA